MSLIKSIEGQTYIAGQTFILFHETLILLVHLQHFADTIGCSFGLIIRGNAAMWNGKKIFDRLIEITIQRAHKIRYLCWHKYSKLLGTYTGKYIPLVCVCVCDRYVRINSYWYAVKMKGMAIKTAFKNVCVSVNFLHWAAYASVQQSTSSMFSFFLWYDSCTIKIPFELH